LAPVECDSNLEIVELLLDQGADPHVTNYEGLAALDRAKGREVKELLGALKSTAPSSQPETAEIDDGT